MNMTNFTVQWIMAGLGILLATAFSGCVGYVGDAGYYNGYYEGGAWVAEPDVYVFGGGYDHRHDWHADSHRGHESLGAAHGSGGHVGGGWHGGGKH